MRRRGWRFSSGATSSKSEAVFSLVGKGKWEAGDGGWDGRRELSKEVARELGRDEGRGGGEGFR